LKKLERPLQHFELRHKVPDDEVLGRRAEFFGGSLQGAGRAGVGPQGREKVKLSVKSALRR